MVVDTTARAILANSLFHSLSRTQTHTLSLSLFHSLSHSLSLSLSVCVLCFVVFSSGLELVKQNNSCYVWLTADFISGIYANLNR